MSGLDAVGDVQVDVSVDGASATGSQSLFDSVLAEFQKGLDNETLTLVIPGRRKCLAARYRVMDEQTVGRVQSAKADTTTESNCLFIAQACVGLLARNPEGEYVDLVDDRGDPLVFNKGLSKMLQHPDLVIARDVVAMVFKHNPVAIGDHSGTLIEWMADTSADVEGAVLGK